MRLAFFLPLVLLASCNSGGCAGMTGPSPYVVPSSKPIPAQPANACALESANIQKLGGCGMWTPTYIDDCNSYTQRELEDHHVVVDHTCIIKAPDCATAKACP